MVTNVEISSVLVPGVPPHYGRLYRLFPANAYRDSRGSAIAISTPYQGSFRGLTVDKAPRLVLYVRFSTAERAWVQIMKRHTNSLHTFLTVQLSD